MLRKRLLEADRLEEAAMSFARSLEVNPDDFRAVKGFVKSQIALDYPEEGSELKEIYDFDDEEFEVETILQKNADEIPNFENFAELSADKDADDENGFEILSADEFNENSAGQDIKTQEVFDEKLQPSDELRVYDEVESVKFYIEQGYQGLAEESLSELENEFGNRQKFIELRQQLTDSSQKSLQSEPENFEAGVSETESFGENSDESIDYGEVQKVEVENSADYENVYAENGQSAADETNKIDENNTKDIAKKSKEYSGIFDSFKDEIGLDKAGDAVQNDFDEYYHHAVVYQEMGMLDEAIREFQDAVNCVEPNDGTNKFLNCSTLIGHCFMEKGMPKLALNWFNNALESCHLGDQEKQGLHYELANAHEVNDENEKALEQFEIIYSMDIDYRDVSKRLENLRENILIIA